MSATQAAVEPLNSTLYRPRLKAVAPITKTRAVLRTVWAVHAMRRSERLGSAR